jgi:hypothetical protein
VQPVAFTWKGVFDLEEGHDGFLIAYGRLLRVCALREVLWALSPFFVWYDEEAPGHQRSIAQGY